MSSTVTANTHDQVNHDGDVDDQHKDFDGCDMFGEFVDFKRDESAGADDGEVFGPAFAQQQAGAFGKKDGRIDKGSHAEGLKLARVDVEGAGEDAVHVMILRVDT